MSKMTRKLLTTEEAAALLGLRPHTLAHYRWRGIGPRFMKVGRRVRYQEQDLWAWVGKPRSSTRDSATA
jgi:predicted DNA-binding transcriptional regulator AlpA